MSKRNSAPTVPWVLTSQVYKWLALAFVLNLLVWFIAIWTVRYSINKDCYDVYDRNIKVAGYWIQIEAGSTKPECPQHD